MSHIGKLLTYILLAANAFVALLFIISAYSPYINPSVSFLLPSMGLGFPVFLLLNVLFLLFWLIVKYKYALFPLVVLLICFPQIRLYIPYNSETKDIPEDCIKILSYNVMSFNSLKRDNEMLKYVAKSDADIVCMQEYGESGHEKYLRKQDVLKILSDYPYYSTMALGDNNRGNQIAVYSKFPILSSKRIPFASLYNGAGAFELKVGNDTLLLINNHLESTKLSHEERASVTEMIKEADAEKVKSGSLHLIRKLSDASNIRAVQADSISNFIKDSKHKSIVVCGDFNDSPISYTHRVVGKGLNDAFEDAGKGLGVSFNRNRFYFRIDHILTSKNIKTYNTKVDNSIDASDHYPIMTYIKIDNTTN